MKVCIGGKYMMKSQQTRGSIKGTGSVPLLDGGKGGQNSYDGIDDYIATTGNAGILGKGLGKNLTDKLGGLTLHRPEPKSRKPQNIKFNL